MINIIYAEDIGLLKCTCNDIERFNNYYLVSASDNDGYIYTGITDLNLHEITLNKYTKFNRIEKVLVPFDMIVTKERFINNEKYNAFSLVDGRFNEIRKPSEYIIDNVNNNSPVHKIKSYPIIKDKCIVMETNFYYYPITKMISYMESYDDLMEVDETREAPVLFDYFDRNAYKKKAKVLSR